MRNIVRRGTRVEEGVGVDALLPIVESGAGDRLSGNPSLTRLPHLVAFPTDEQWDVIRGLWIPPSLQLSNLLDSLVNALPVFWSPQIIAKKIEEYYGGSPNYAVYAVLVFSHRASLFSNGIARVIRVYGLRFMESQTIEYLCLPFLSENTTISCVKGYEAVLRKRLSDKSQIFSNLRR